MREAEVDHRSNESPLKWREKQNTKKIYAQPLRGAATWKDSPQHVSKGTADLSGKKRAAMKAGGIAMHGWSSVHPKIRTVQENWKWLHLDRIGRTDLICFGWSTWLLDQSLSGTKLVANGWRDWQGKTNFRQYCVEDNIQDCKLGLFQHTSFAGDSQYFLSKFGGFPCVFWITNICTNFLDVQQEVNRRVCLTAVPKQKPCLWSSVWERRVFQHCKCGNVF